MPNPYNDIFEDNGEEYKKPASQPPPSLPLEEEDRFIMDGKEPLDEILENNQFFQQKAESFSQLLSQTRAIDHQVTKGLTRLFLFDEDTPDKKSLQEERQYHQLLGKKFEKIMVPMRALAEIHLATIQQFNLSLIHI